MGGGSFAEYAVVRESKLARMPQNLSFEQAAVVPISAGTALQALDAGRTSAGPAGVDHRRLRRCRQLRRAAGEDRSVRRSPVSAVPGRSNWSGRWAPTT